MAIGRRSTTLQKIVTEAGKLLDTPLSEKQQKNLADRVPLDSQDPNILLWKVMEISEDPLLDTRESLDFHQILFSRQPPLIKVKNIQALCIWIAYSKDDNWEKAKSTGCSPSAFKKLKSTVYNLKKVRETLEIISHNDHNLSSLEVTLLKLSALWL